jgi:metal-sulfur cluster biosynthetic enzyme
MPHFTEDDVRERLREQVYDPEIGINVVDLGLIYGIELDEHDGKTDVLITMTLTSFGCPLGPILVEEIQQALADLPNIGEIDINLVWSPPWTPDMMSEEAKEELGIW